MNLPGLKLDALKAASLRSINQRLSNLLLEALNDSLPRFHTRPEYVPMLVADAGALVSLSGYSWGREYGVLVVNHFLLGLGWWNDPSCKSLRSILNAPGLTQDEWLALLTVKALAYRSEWQCRLVSMHDITVGLLRLPDGQCDDEQLWRSLQQVLSLRDIPDDEQHACYCCYEADACERYALPAINHVNLNDNEIRGYRYYGKRLPQPSDDLRNLPSLSRSRVLAHILLAITFGRHFHRNPLFTHWVAVIDDAGTAADLGQTLARQLANHQRALKEPSPHD